MKAKAVSSENDGITMLERLDHRIETFSDRAYQQLRAKLVMGQFVPGDQVTIRAVANLLGVSFTPVRDALSRLVAEGTLKGHPRFYSVPVLTLDQIREIFDVRMLLEGRLAESAAENVTEEDIAELEVLQSRLVGSGEIGDSRVRLHFNHDFHFKVYSLANMQIVFSLVEMLWARIGPSLNYLYPEPVATSAPAEKTVHAHDLVIKALRERDPKKARQAIVSDVSMACKRIERALSARDKQ